jgi:hypothetical protein
VCVRTGIIGAQQRSAFAQQGDAVLDALERLDHITLEADQDADGVFVGAAADLAGVALRRRDDLAALDVGRLGEPALVDQEGRLLLGLGEDALGLLLGLLDDPLTLGIDPFGGTDLFRDRDAQFVDEAKGGVLVDDDVRRQGELLAVRDEGLESLDEEDDVDGSALQAGEAGVSGWRQVSHATASLSGSRARRGVPGRRPPAPSTRRRRRSQRSP